jgi:hypothetical protein
VYDSVSGIWGPGDGLIQSPPGFDVHISYPTYSFTFSQFNPSSGFQATIWVQVTPAASAILAQSSFSLTEYTLQVCDCGMQRDPLVGNEPHHESLALLGGTILFWSSNRLVLILCEDDTPWQVSPALMEYKIPMHEVGLLGEEVVLEVVLS